jgi:hypothetical protein
LVSSSSKKYCEGALTYCGINIFKTSGASLFLITAIFCSILSISKNYWATTYGASRIGLHRSLLIWMLPKSGPCQFCNFTGLASVMKTSYFMFTFFIEPRAI